MCPSGGVWVCGCVGSCECVSPRSMPFMHVCDLGGGFVQAALGRDHLVFLTSEGRVYLQGRHCHPDDVMDSPQLVEGVLWRHHIVQVGRVLSGVCSAPNKQTLLALRVVADGGGGVQL